jgi:hypothetical protein
MKNYLCYWQEGPILHKDVLNHTPLGYCGSNQFNRVSVGDTLWIITRKGNHYFILGKLKIGSISGRQNAAHLLQNSGFMVRNCAYHVLAERGTETQLGYRKCDKVLTKLTVISGKKVRPLLQNPKDQLLPQQLQAMRCLSEKSATILEKLLS